MYLLWWMEHSYGLFLKVFPINFQTDFDPHCSPIMRLISYAFQKEIFNPLFFVTRRVIVTINYFIIRKIIVTERIRKLFRTSMYRVHLLFAVMILISSGILNNMQPHMNDLWDFLVFFKQSFSYENSSSITTLTYYSSWFLIKYHYYPSINTLWLFLFSPR